MKHYSVNQISDPVLLMTAASAVLMSSFTLCSQTNIHCGFMCNSSCAYILVIPVLYLYNIILYASPLAVLFNRYFGK